MTDLVEDLAQKVHNRRETICSMTENPFELMNVLRSQLSARSIWEAVTGQPEELAYKVVSVIGSDFGGWSNIPRWSRVESKMWKSSDDRCSLAYNQCMDLCDPRTCDRGEGLTISRIQVSTVDSENLVAFTSFLLFLSIQNYSNVFFFL
jgi:hypothetical protein